MCIASDSDAIWLGKFPSRGKAMHGVMCFCLQVGEFNPAHFEAEAKTHYATVLGKTRPTQQEMAFGTNLGPAAALSMLFGQRRGVTARSG
jgi:hypothetical protein